MFVEAKEDVDLVFAVNKTGSFFGDVDFTQSSEDHEARREFSVKAKTNVELLTLSKEDLFKLDQEFASEIKQLFSHSLSNY